MKTYRVVDDFTLIYKAEVSKVMILGKKNQKWKYVGSRDGFITLTRGSVTITVDNYFFNTSFREVEDE